MSALGLPASPNLEHLKNEAKELLASFRIHDAKAVRRVEAALRLTPFPPTRMLRLSDAQLVVARDYGFASWPRLRNHVLRIAKSPVQSSIGGDPEALAVYREMIAAFRAAQSLSFEIRSEHRYWLADESVTGMTRLWLSKPNQLRQESFDSSGALYATSVVSDGRLLGYWYGKRPKYEGEEEDAYQRTCENAYYQRDVDMGSTYPFLNDTAQVLRMMPFIQAVEPGLFFRREPPRNRLIVAYRSYGTEVVDGQICDIVEIEMSIETPHRSTRIWIARSDRFPRRAIETWAGAMEWTTTEEWRNVSPIAEMPDGTFRWEPPDGWTRWSLAPDAGLIAPGTPAPDFDVALLDGGKLNPAKLRGWKVALALGWGWVAAW
ncbi:MAG: hypothetical protein P4L33_22590 [Capsulimonadaceae bacterium]|nr:hypothetical protein [Capsulimonadaceae bacterium]